MSARLEASNGQVEGAMMHSEFAMVAMGFCVVDTNDERRLGLYRRPFRDFFASTTAILATFASTTAILATFVNVETLFL